MITNEIEQEHSGKLGKKRECYEVIHALAGGLGLWAGVEAVTHFLQLLKVIGAEKTDLKKKRY